MKNTQSARRDQRLRKIERHRAIIRKCKQAPCADCGVEYPYWVMDFDHIQGEKRFEMCSVIYRSRTALFAELAKCEVVCANCHRDRSYRRITSQEPCLETPDYEPPVALAEVVVNPLDLEAVDGV